MRRVLKWTGIFLGALVLMLLLAIAGIYLASNARLSKVYAINLPPVAVPSDSVSLAHGRHVAIVRGCVDCHGEDLGGQPFIDDPALVSLYASNLTSGVGGIGGAYTDEDWVRAIRHGVGPDGKPLLWMPSHEFYPISDRDMGALIAFLKQAAPVDLEHPTPSVGPVGRALYMAGVVPLVPAELIAHDSPRPDAPPAGPTAEYGAYLATTCTGCHGNSFSGGPIPGAPPDMPVPTNITSDAETGIGDWTEDDFFVSLREGKRPDGTELDPFMPYRLTKHMTDDEIRALWLYLRTIPAQPEGNR